MPLTNITATNLRKITGTSLTGRDWSSDFANLDIALSALRNSLKPTRATPVQELSTQSIPASDKTEFTISDADGYSAAVITIKATYNASATQRVRV